MSRIVSILAHHGITDTITINGITFTGEDTAIDNARAEGIIRVCFECGSVMGIDMSVPGTTEDNRIATRDNLDDEALAFCCSDNADTYIL